jgi:hypothetical protein
MTILTINRMNLFMKIARRKIKLIWLVAVLGDGD